MDFITRYKKIFFVTGFFLSVFLIGFLLYTLFFKPLSPVSNVTPPATSTPPGGFPSAGTSTGGQITTDPGQFPPGNYPGLKEADPVAKGGLTVATSLIESPISGLAFDHNGTGVRYYNKEDGKFYRIDVNGEAHELSSKVFYEVQSITWSKNSEKAVLEYPDGANILYDFASESQTTLPAHWKDFDFSPLSDELVMKSIGLDQENRWLAITNSDGTKTRTLEPLGGSEEIVIPSWSPNNQTVAMYLSGGNFDQQNVYFIGQNSENFKSLKVEGRGFDPLWSPKGDKLLYSVFSTATDLKPVLWVSNAAGDQIGSGRKKIELNTWASKCAFADETRAYCAVPRQLENGAGLFPELSQNTNDDLYMIDISTGYKSLVAIPDGNYNMSSLIVTDGGRNLYYTDKNTGKLYKIKLQ